MRKSPDSIASFGPLDALGAWPHDRPVVLLHSGGAVGPWSRWSILGEPVGYLLLFRDRAEWAPATAAATGASPVAIGQLIQRTRLSTRCETAGFDPVTSLIDALQLRPRPEEGEADDGEAPPFRGGWIGCVNYELGHVIEPRSAMDAAGRLAGDEMNDAPLAEFAWIERPLTYDRIARAWWSADGDDRLDSLRRSAGESARATSFELSDWIPHRPREHVEAAIARAIEYIRAGDVFQTNITQRFHATFQGDRRQLFAALARRSGSWYSAYLELDARRSILSLSPELFVDFDARSRRVMTRPIKGSAPSSRPAVALLNSEKDAAELNMIIDLMRNDLGRVCEYGSVRVVEPRTIESHPTIRHGVATIEGRLRADAHFGDLLRATFPAGSITGAPKIRAMQIINELEGSARGAYCGSVGFVSRHGRAMFNVAIRTITIDGSHATYGAGGGIVADSTPHAEYEEALNKTEVVRSLHESKRIHTAEPAKASEALF